MASANFSMMGGGGGGSLRASLGGAGGRPKAQGKKMLIKNLKAAPVRAGEPEEGRGWAQLWDAVAAIQEERKVGTSLEELYAAVDGLCSAGRAEAVYDRLRSACQQQLPKLRSPTEDAADFLRLLNGLWETHCAQMLMIRSVFLVLDRTYVLHNATVLSLWDLGLEEFRSKIVKGDADVESRLVQGLLDQIDRERAGEQVERGLLKSLLRMLGSLQIYREVFEGAFLGRTEALYAAEGRRLVGELEVPAYLLHVERRLAEEDERLDRYLDPNSTRKPLVAAVEQLLVGAHVDTVLAKGLDMLLAANRREDLRRLYLLLARSPKGPASLKQGFQDYVKKVGSALVLDVQREKELVGELLALKAATDAVMAECWDSAPAFVQAQRDAFAAALNSRPNKPAELIAKFMDARLRSGNKEASEEELERMMDQLILLFRFIQGKDVFEAFYKKDLAKRLLLGKSASVDAEKAMLCKLKAECGPAFTGRLEGMFKDMELSKDLAAAFKAYLASKEPNPSLDLNVSILTMGNWPNYVPQDVHLPRDLVRYQEEFKTFYLSKHSGRKLVWQPGLGHCLLRARFGPSGKSVKELQVSLYQALVLLLFNEAERWAYKDVATSTNLDGPELKRTLQSLACGKFRVIQKVPRGKEVEESDEFVFNDTFSDRLFRIRINQVQLKETTEEAVATTEQVFQDRQYQIDAAIVRVMKMRKTLSHALLISELFAQLRFPVRPPDLKKRIESLIDRDYMCRDSADSNLYNYVA